MKYLDDFEERTKKLYEFKKSILKLIDEYVLYNDKFRKSKKTILTDDAYNGAKDFNFFYRNNKKILNVVFWSNAKIGGHDMSGSGNFHFEPNELKDLEKFMENPDLYKAAKKYNIS